MVTSYLQSAIQLAKKFEIVKDNGKIATHEDTDLEACQRGSIVRTIRGKCHTGTKMPHGRKMPHGQITVLPKLACVCIR